MKRDPRFACLVACASVAWLLGASHTAPTSDVLSHPTGKRDKLEPSRSVARVAHRPTSFTPNRGQWPDSVLFLATGSGSTFWFTRTGLYQALPARVDKHARAASASSDGHAGQNPRTLIEPGEVAVELVRTEFLGAASSVTLVGQDELEWKCNYFFGDDPALWRTDVPNYSSVTYKNLYPGVDVQFTNRHGRLEGAFHSTSGADLSQVRFRMAGTAQLTVEADGSLRAVTPSGCIVGWAASGVDCVRTDDGTFRFGRQAALALPASAPAAPTLVYSTFLGGGGEDEATAIAVDDSGYVYVSGSTLSASFPLEVPLDSVFDAWGNYECFVTKLNKAGSFPVYSTYLGGSGRIVGIDESSRDHANDIAVDPFGRAHVVGWTQATDFPTVNPYQTNQPQSDVFVSRLGAAGNSLEYSTYISGNRNDYGEAIALDDSGHAYITGETSSDNFPTVNPYQMYQGPVPENDLFVAKLSAAGNSLIYSTYIGGNTITNEEAEGIAVDDSGYAYVTAFTEATNFPTVNPFQTNQAQHDAVVFKLSRSGNSLVYSTYLGGGGGDWPEAIAVDDSGQAWVAGWTGSTNFPTLNPFMVDSGGVDGFVTKLNAAGNGLIYSTYLGVTGTGVGADFIYDLALDPSGKVHVTGYSNSFTYPKVDPVQAFLQGSTDVIVSTLNATGSGLTFSTMIGSTAWDHGTGIALDNDGNIYVVGYTDSTNATAFPTVNPYQTDQGGRDAFVLKIGTAASCPIALTGDINVSGTINSSDIILLVNYVFKSGAAPLPCEAAGDINCNGVVNSADIILLVNYVFKSGPPPCDACTSSLAAACS